MIGRIRRLHDSCCVKIERDKLVPRMQNNECVSYPNASDLIIDLIAVDSCEDHRALTKPFLCTDLLTFDRTKEIAQRVYRKTGGHLLVCALDQAIWITYAEFLESGSNAYEEIERYDTFATIREATLNYYT